MRGRCNGSPYKNHKVELVECENPNCKRSFWRSTEKRSRLPLGVKSYTQRVCSHSCSRERLDLVNVERNNDKLRMRKKKNKLKMEAK